MHVHRAVGRIACLSLRRSTIEACALDDNHVIDSLAHRAPSRRGKQLSRLLTEKKSPPCPEIIFLCVLILSYLQLQCLPFFLNPRSHHTQGLVPRHTVQHVWFSSGTQHDTNPG